MLEDENKLEKIDSSEIEAKDVIEGSYIDITYTKEEKAEEKKPDIKTQEAVNTEEASKDKEILENTQTEQTDKSAFYTETVLEEKPKKEYSKFKYFVAGILVASIVGGSMAGIGMQLSKPIADKVALMIENKENNKLAQIEDNSTDNLTQVNTKIETTVVAPAVAIYKAVSPAVVGITSTVTSKDYFYGTYDSTSTGSGIVFDNTDSKVYIVTNYHVIEGANKVAVTLNGGETAQAEIVGADEQTDLAVLSVDKTKLDNNTISSIVVASFGDSSKLEVGELAIAIGNPLGSQFSNSISQGIISGLDRLIQVDDRNLTMIQTDAAINPGNSGGPLVNSNGQVIGINTVKYSDSSVEGMGFAIPTDIAKPIIEELRSKGYISRPLLGVRGATVTEQISEVWGYPIGVCVVGVTQNSAAYRAGITKGDVITEFDGEKIISMEQLTQLIKQHKVGDTVTIKYVRNNQTKETKAVLQESTTTQETQQSQSDSQNTPNNNYNSFFNDYFNYYFNPFGR